jgi:glycolate oxidase FAD binding subunit
MDVSAVAGRAVARTLRPATPREAAEALAECASRGEKVLPVGAGRSLSAGGAPNPCDVALSLEGLAGIVDYSPGDMTITVLAGTPLSTIEQTVAPRGQRLPGLPEGEGTIGGLLATGWTRPGGRESQGSLRERLLGAQIADTLGRVTRSGGRVVKNVTGYDVHRMHVGAGGAFGVFTELTFRLEPRPEARDVVTLEAPSWQAAHDAWRWLRLEGPDVAFVELVGLGFVGMVEGDEEPARRAAEDLAQGWGRFGTVQSRAPRAGTPAGASGELPRLVIALRVAPSQALALHERVAAESVCYPQSGEICLELTGSAEVLTARVRAFAEAARAGGPAYRVQEEEPVFLPSDLPRWSADPGALRLLARVKRALDPSGILRPGSYSADTLERAAAYFAEKR